jgi:hypothetical protein
LTALRVTDGLGPEASKRFNGTQRVHARFLCTTQEAMMGLGKGALLWMIGIPLPIIILLALFWH